MSESRSILTKSSLDDRSRPIDPKAKHSGSRPRSKSNLKGLTFGTSYS